MAATEREIAAAAGLDQEDPRYEAATFGREVEEFIDVHPVGQYLIKRAQRDIETAQEGLLDVDPEDTKAVRKLQNQAAVANNVRTWLREAITEGRNATLALQQERDEHAA